MNPVYKGKGCVVGGRVRTWRVFNDERVCCTRGNGVLWGEASEHGVFLTKRGCVINEERVCH